MGSSLSLRIEHQDGESRVTPPAEPQNYSDTHPHTNHQDKDTFDGQDGRKVSFMDSSFRSSAESWDKLLTHQVSLFSASEMSYLATLPEWVTSRKVADVGCGNGDYLDRLLGAFPYKSYVGIDSSPQLIDIARERHAGSKTDYYIADIIHEAPDLEFDAIVLRFVVQHLPDALGFFKSLRRLCHAQSMVVIFEPSPSECSAAPELAKLGELVRRYDEQCRALGSTRARIHEPGRFKLICGDEWKVTREHAILSRHERATWIGSDLAQVFNGWITALERSEAVACDFGAVRTEVADWINSTGNSVDMVLNAWVLRPA
jgi:trans-aconitate methyltransferase